MGRIKNNKHRSYQNSRWTSENTRWNRARQFSKRRIKTRNIITNKDSYRFSLKSFLLIATLFMASIITPNKRNHRISS